VDLKQFEAFFGLQLQGVLSNHHKPAKLSNCLVSSPFFL